MPCSETRRRTTGESNLFETLAGIAVRVAVATLAAAGCITGAGAGAGCATGAGAGAGAGAGCATGAGAGAGCATGAGAGAGAG